MRNIKMLWMLGKMYGRDNKEKDSNRDMAIIIIVVIVMRVNMCNNKLKWKLIRRINKFK